MPCPLDPRGAAVLCLLAAAVIPCLGAAPTVDSVVVFNEINYNPAGASEDGEWIELHNQMAVNVDLSHWRISGGIDYAFPAGTVIPGKGFLVVAKNPAASGVTGALGPWRGSLDNDGETIRLRDINDRVLDVLSYGDRGKWPIGADGSGATLAKQWGDLSSNRPESWRASSELGGTPGRENFPPPPAPVSHGFINRHDGWKYFGGGRPQGDWTAVAFDDAAWATGDAGFKFGDTRVYQDAPPVKPGGFWSLHRWSGDADSQISSTKTYTHKVSIARNNALLPINGVTFDAAASGVTSGSNWSLDGAPNVFNNNGNGAGANNLPAGSGSRQLAEDFRYGNSLDGVSRLSFSGLTAGQSYVATFYNVGFGGPEGRRMNIIPSDSGQATTVDQNTTGSGNGLLVRYHYKAPDTGRIHFDFLPLGVNATWHHYAFSNEVAPAIPDERPLQGVRVASVSSELTTGFQRGAANAVNGSGLSDTGAHVTVPDNNMWLSTGTFAAPNDPLPAEITFDLGKNTDLTAIRIWNYNERAGNSDLTTRGARDIRIATGPSADGPFTEVGSRTLRQAFGVTGEIGERVPLSAQGVRFVRLTIVNTHGGDNEMAGLSEVKFYEAGLVTQGDPVPFRSRITSLYDTGVDDQGNLVEPGRPDPHYTIVGAGPPVLVQSAHPAWLGVDGLSQWIGRTASGGDNVPAGTLTYRTTFNLTAGTAPSALLKLFVAVDNSLDTVRLNGSPVNGVTAANFAGYVGPLVIPGPFNVGSNTLEFVWNNAGTDPNPGGLRLMWDATTEADLARTVLATNPTTLYLRRTFRNPGSANSRYLLHLESVVDDGAIFYLNGQEIHRVNMPAGPVSENTTASSSVAFPKFAGVDLPATSLREGDNVLAVELHQATAGDADAFFLAALRAVEIPQPPAASRIRLNELAAATAAAGSFFVELGSDAPAPTSLQGYRIVTSSGATYELGAVSVPAGGTLALDESLLGFRPADGEKIYLLDPSGQSLIDAVEVKNRAQARTARGQWQTPSASTPGAANAFSISRDIVINEIMYHRHPAYLPTGRVANPEEWIELYNRGTAPVSLEGWKLAGGISFTFPAVTVPPDGYLVVAKNAAALSGAHPGISVIGDFSGSLSNRDDEVRVEDANGNTVNAVHYYSGGRWDDRADGGGSSLELRHPAMDNSVPEAWAASDESRKAPWHVIDYTASGAPPAGSNDPTQYHEFITGLLAAGVVEIDDVSVREVTANNRELIQSGNFEGGSAAFWRLLGNHGGHGLSRVVDDPLAPGNKVLRLVATGPTEHMHNHAETTLKSGNSYVALSSTATYRISLRARWVSGMPRLHTRLYFNRAARQHILPTAEKTGTPGARNSGFQPVPAPTFHHLSHLPVVPPPNAPATVRVEVRDAAALQSVNLKWRPDGGEWQTLPMSAERPGTYTGDIPAQRAATLVQFYIEASNSLGGTATFPAAGADSRALIKWGDGLQVSSPGHSFRILLPAEDSLFLHAPTNVMSNHSMPATVVYRDSEVFYDAAVSLKSSQRGRLGDSRVGFSVDFDPMHLFRGAHENVNLDRSSIGRGSQGSAGGGTGTGFGQIEILNWQFINRAGGIPGMYNDLVYVHAPRSQHSGSAMLTMAEYNDVYLDTQFRDGGDGPTFKYELIYYPTTTNTGTPEGLKLPQPDNVLPVNINQINTPNDKESYRWNFIIQNDRADDDYSGIIGLNQTLRMPTSTAQQKEAFAQAIEQVLDVDVYLRAMAAMTLTGTVDHYVDGFQHNLKLFDRPEDRRLVFLPWDFDFLSAGVNNALVKQGDLSKILDARPEWHRRFYGHLRDLIATSFNGGYLNSWATHFQQFLTGGQNMSAQLDYIVQRAAYAQGQVSSIYPATAFAITTNGGGDFSTANWQATLSGNAGVDVRWLRVAGSEVPLPVTWTARQSWQVTVPVAPGANAYTIEALDYRGEVIERDTITITGTGNIEPASAANLVVSEIHYHPAAPSQAEIDAGFGDADDFEFIEVQNIGSAQISLSGVRFVTGIDYAFPTGATLAPGAVAVVPRVSAAFSLRHPGVQGVLPAFGTATGNRLSNGGEMLVLVDAAGADIKRFAYADSAPWPAAADGSGPSLVLISPRSNPDHANPLNWRASAAAGGNPGGSDTLPPPANPAADADGDGLPDGVNQVLGGRARISLDGRSLSIFRNSQADGRLVLQRSSDLRTWEDVTPLGISRRAEAGLVEELTYTLPAARSPQGEYYRFRVLVP